ncbi:hypothetical protein EVAR_5893_1 [Eumeta japonica]|uniref:Uncharacterized protein n=1 Tax=Eumeta variegata TaxID=151549 RepID=A0A4C1TFI5_EUMVA|nr:hypothetical protein EVAR_5893_1 [Eumeta japonica]
MPTVDDNISALRLMIGTNKIVIYQHIGTSLVIGTNQVHKIFHKYLAVRKLCIRWIPHNLTEAQKLRRVNWCREMLQRFAGGDSSAVYDIVTAEESGTYCCDLETKRMETPNEQTVFWFREIVY